MLVKDLEKANDETLLMAYQSMTVLARFMWDRQCNPKLAGRLHRITCPTLILWGESDGLLPVAHGDAYHRLIPGSRLHVIQNCGHLPMFECEQEFVEAVAKFCLEPSGSANKE
jgi:pimeloyl-ACP methyl ester carboxylesterase